jgi:hypothetical protein
VMTTKQLVPFKPAQSSKLNALKEFKFLIADTDRLRNHYDKANGALDSVRRGHLGDAEFWEDDSAELREDIARCEAMLARFDRDELYQHDEDGRGDLKYEFINKRLGRMYDSYPNMNPNNADFFLENLTEMVAAVERVDALALESACREIVELARTAAAISVCHACAKGCSISNTIIQSVASRLNRCRLILASWSRSRGGRDARPAAAIARCRPRPPLPLASPRHGLKPHRIDLDEHALAGALIASGRLTEAEALRPELIERELAALVGDFVSRWRHAVTRLNLRHSP